MAPENALSPQQVVLFGEGADTWKQLYVSSKSLGGKSLQVIHTLATSPSLLSSPPWCELSAYILVGTDRMLFPPWWEETSLKLWSRINSPLIWFQLHILSHDTTVTHTAHCVQVFLLLPMYHKPVSDSQPHVSVFLCVMRNRSHLTLGFFFFSWVTVLNSSGWPQTH